MKAPGCMAYGGPEVLELIEVPTPQAGPGQIRIRVRALADLVRAVAPGGVDAVLDGAGGDALAVSLELVAEPDRILTLVEHARAEELGVRVTANLRSAARLAALVDLHTRGLLRIHIRRSYPLHRAADAHRDVESRHGRGRVVLAI